ncbi:hypothetical protein O1B53_002970 [Vibrio cholerae]|nr:hypothetical protein [Vibrio cholerae]
MDRINHLAREVIINITTTLKWQSESFTPQKKQQGGIMQRNKVKDLLQESYMHTMFGAAAFLPAVLAWYSMVLNAFSSGQPVSTLTAMTPFILMFVTTLAVYIQIIRHMRVKLAKNALYLLTCGVSAAALYVGTKVLGDVEGLFCATFIPYLYVRIIGHRLYKKDLDLSHNEILEANQNV